MEGLIAPSISENNNAFLYAIPEDSEIFVAVKLLGSHKAPVLNGLTALFFKTLWLMVGAKVIVMVRNFFLF